MNTQIQNLTKADSVKFEKLITKLKRRKVAADVAKLRLEETAEEVKAALVAEITKYCEDLMNEVTQESTLKIDDNQ